MPFQLNQYITNLFTLNVRGENITHQSSLGENKSLWRFEKTKQTSSNNNKKKKTLKSFLCTTTASHLRIIKLCVTTLTLTPERCEGAEKRGSGPGDCSAERVRWVRSLQKKGMEMGSTPMKPSGPPQTMCWEYEWNSGGGAAAVSAVPAQQAAGTGPMLRAC